jgi:hypothetical protein
MKSYDTNAEHAATAPPIGHVGTNVNFDIAIEESYAYDLWDRDKTTGCKCDPGFYGVDCSLKKCKYGIDPYFYDITEPLVQTTVVHLGSKGQTSRGELSGTFRMVFFDVFGEKYVTQPVEASPTYITHYKVRQARSCLFDG